MLFLITWWVRWAKLLTFVLPTMWDPCVRSSGPGQSPGRRRWYCTAVPLSFGTAVVNTGSAGKLEFWLNVHFLEKCLLSTGILTFWWRPKTFWPKHVGGFESSFGVHGRQDIQKLPQTNSRGNGFILVSFRGFPESSLFFLRNFSVWCEHIVMPYNLPAREQERYQTGLTERWKDLVWYISPQSNLVAWEENA